MNDQKKKLKSDFMQRFGKMKKIFKIIFIVSGLGMIWWIIFWPGVLITEKDRLIAGIGMDVTAIIFVASGIGWLILYVKKK